VSDILVHDNQAVTRGTVLFRIDQARYAVALREAVPAQAASDEAGAAYALALAQRDAAKLNLERSDVRASVNGLLTNFGLGTGNHVDAGHPVLALIDTDSFYADGYFEETKLPRIHVGDDGHVDSVAGGIAARERQESGDLLANVNPTFSWVRLAHRVPVRIALDHVPAGVRLVTGRTATVEIVPAPTPQQRAVPIGPARCLQL
jgi:multidrug resistance efflux pump